MGGPAPSVQYSWDGPGALGAGDDGKALCWNQATGRFAMVAKAAAAHTHAPSDLSQGGASSGQVLAWNGSAWVATTISSGVTAHSALTGLTSGDDHTQYAVIAPSASTRNVIQPTGAAVKPLVIKGASSQSANLLEVQTSAGTALLTLDPTGLLTLSQLAGTNGKTLKIVPAPEGASGNIVEVITRNPGSATIGFSIGAYGAVAMTSPVISTSANITASFEWWGNGGINYDMVWNDFGFASTAWARFSSKSSPTNGAAVWIQNPTGVGNHVLRLKGKASQTGHLLLCEDSSAALQFAVEAGGKLRTNQAVTNTNTPSGATAKALPFYDASGTLLGYAPLYASTW